MAHAPNLGYLAQGFVVDDLPRAYAAAIGLGATVVVAPLVEGTPGLGPREQFIVRNPGSGALQWIFGPAYSR